MAQHDSYPGRGEGLYEEPVAPRYSFADRSLRREDRMIISYNQSRRVISYPVPPDDVIGWRQSLMDQGLVLGERLQEYGGMEHFEVRTSASPLSYEASAHDGGEFKYDDNMMFYDLGQLLRRIARTDEESTVVLNGTIGKNVTALSFTRPGARRLLLVPGFELSLGTVDDTDAALSLYSGRLYQEFDSRFDDNRGSFTEGFSAN